MAASASQIKIVECIEFTSYLLPLQLWYIIYFSMWSNVMTVNRAISTIPWTEFVRNFCQNICRISNWMIFCFGVVWFQYGLKQHFMDQIELDHVSQVIGYHPSYLEHFLKIQTFIMQGDGPLPYDYRHYLAIIVSKHHFYCAIYITIHFIQFRWIYSHFYCYCYCYCNCFYYRLRHVISVRI